MNRIRLLQGVALFSASAFALGAQPTSDPGGLTGPASTGPQPTVTTTIDLSSDLSTTTRPATASSSLAPTRFGNVILTQTPSNATGAGGVSTVFSDTGSQFTFGSGGSLVDPADFQYEVTGDNTATLTVPAADGTPAATTELVFNDEKSGTYTTVSDGATTSGTFGLSTIPTSAPLANLSARTRLTGDNQTILGFVIAGNAPRQVLIRAVGPSLANFGVTQPLQNPSVHLFRGPQLIAVNEQWTTLLPHPPATPSAGDTAGAGTGTGTDTTGTGTTVTDSDGNPTAFTGTFEDGQTFMTRLATAEQFTTVGAFALDPASEDAAFVATLPPGAYTVVVSRNIPAGPVDDEEANDDTGANPRGRPGTETDTDPDTEPNGAAGSGEVLVEVYFVE